MLTSLICQRYRQLVSRGFSHKSHQASTSAGGVATYTPSGAGLIWETRKLAHLKASVGFCLKASILSASERVSVNRYTINTKDLLEG